MKGFVYNIETLTLDQIELYNMMLELKKENEDLKKMVLELKNN